MTPLRLFVRRAVLLALLTVPALPAITAAQAAATADLQAAFLINFARFTEWPASASGQPIQICVAGDERVARAAAAAGRGQRIAGRAIETVELDPGDAAGACHVLFVARSFERDSARMLTGARALPVLTVSDIEGFAIDSGIIELIVDEGHMRFSVNAGAARRAGLRLSSRLLGLAKVVHGQNY